MESVFSGELGRECQVAAACRPMIGCRSRSYGFQLVAGQLDCHRSSCSSRMAPMRRAMASSVGKMSEDLGSAPEFAEATEMP